jgi:hypothetical protein
MEKNRGAATFIRCAFRQESGININRWNVEKKEWKLLFNHSQIFTFVLNKNIVLTRSNAEKASLLIRIAGKIKKIRAGYQGVLVNKRIVFCNARPGFKSLFWTCCRITGNMLPAGSFFCFTTSGNRATALQQRQLNR